MKIFFCIYILNAINNFGFTAVNNVFAGDVTITEFCALAFFFI